MINKYYFIFILSILGLAFHQAAYSQNDVIRLQNPSFEDLPTSGKAPIGWYDCGFPGESPPDIQPETTFKVARSAYEGGTYLGMVVRDTDTWERVGQKLSRPIQGNQCYSFSIFSCRSPVYESRSQKTGRMTNYTRPAKLRIWGGDDYCAKREQLAETNLISNYEWKRFDFRFEPKMTHKYIVFEAFYETPILFPYNGNILLDNASDIIQLSCDDNVHPIAQSPEVNFLIPSAEVQKIDGKNMSVQARIENVSVNLNITFLVNGRSYTNFHFDPNTGIFQADLRNLKNGRNTIQIMANNEAGNSQDKAVLIHEKEPVYAEAPANTSTYEALPPPNENIQNSTPSIVKEQNSETSLVSNKEDMEIEGISRKNMKAGQTIRLKKLYFGVDESSISANNTNALDEMYRFLKYNSDVTIEIGGHTNGNCDHQFCDELSKARAKSVADYLIAKGIDNNRLHYKGYGKRKPISSNRTAVGRKKNQRVEIKILTLND